MAICLVPRGDLPIAIHWTLNNKPIGQFDGVSAVNTNTRASQLTVESAQAHHRGEYKCVAKNKAGVTEFSAFLNVNGTVTICSPTLFYYNPTSYFIPVKIRL